MYILAKVLKSDSDAKPAYVYYCTETETRSSIRRSILGALTQGLDMPGLTFFFRTKPVSDSTQSTPLIKSSVPICPEDYPELFI
jgi:hypothetical protein